MFDLVSLKFRHAREIKQSNKYMLSNGAISSSNHLLNNKEQE
jgi:hypothetical protein